MFVRRRLPTPAPPPSLNPRPTPPSSFETELHKLPRVLGEAGPQPGRGQAAAQPARGPALAELHAPAVKGDPQNGGEERGGGGGGGRGAVRGEAQRDGEATAEG